MLLYPLGVRDEEDPMHDHDQHMHATHTGSASWAMAAQATLHCLTGCAIGEGRGMAIATAAGLHNGPPVVLSIALAFVFGDALPMRGPLRSGLPLRQALQVA